MRTEQEILDKIETIEPVLMEHRKIFLISYLSKENARQYFQEGYDGGDWVPSPRDEDAILGEMLGYMPFAWDKANGCRGLSAGRSMMHMAVWLWMLGEGEAFDEVLDYGFYGKPQLREICKHFGWDWRKWDDGIWRNDELVDGLPPDQIPDSKITWRGEAMPRKVSMIEYGAGPGVLGMFELDTGEMMHYLYLPIKMRELRLISIPKRLKFCFLMINAIVEDAIVHLGEEEFNDHYVYLTAKSLYVTPESPGNRPGWHADGYGSNGDLNYIWHDKNPTEFAEQEFKDIPDDDFASMEEMENQIDPANIVTYPNRMLLRLDETVVHRVGPVIETGVRTFIKVSISKHKYNLLGNSHNYLIDYNWEMHDRAETRNCDNKDFVGG